MVDFDDTTEDLDALIDRAVDTFFVEQPDEQERAAAAGLPPESVVRQEADPPAAPPTSGPSFEEAVDTLFMGAFEENKAPRASYDPRSYISSGDEETDRAIDLAVDTLFVEEEAETAAPETTQLDVRMVHAPPVQETKREAPAPMPKKGPPPPRRLPDTPARPALEVSPPAPAPRLARPSSTSSAGHYDDAMAHAVQRHMHTLYREASQDSVKEPPVLRKAKPTRQETLRFRSLQEAILTLEWEISQRSVTALANEIKKVRAEFKDNVTVDFAVLSMRIVLDYVVKRMSRAHPESIRFLLDVTDYLGKGVTSSVEDPLQAFHHILSRYERYKSSVRRAEGIPDTQPDIVNNLSIKDPATFGRTVALQALTIKRAGESLAAKLESSQDSINLIRSFRFLVNRAFNRILEGTCEQKPQNSQPRKVRRRD